MSTSREDTQHEREGERKRWWNPLRIFGRGGKPDSQIQPVLARGIASDVMVVVQFRPAWEIQAYLRFARLPYRVENSRYPGSESTGLYPALIDGQFIVPGPEAPLHVARMRWDLDRNLTEEERAETQAFVVLVREGLQPLLRVIRYRAGPSAVSQTVHPAMKTALPWPLTWWSPGAEERRSEKEASARGLNGLKKADLLKQARALYSALDLRLGKQDAFFFGATPTSLDACVFGHLAEAWGIGDLLDLLPAFDNLSRFFRHICDKYFRVGSYAASHQDHMDGYASDGGVCEGKGGAAESGEGHQEERSFSGVPGEGAGPADIASTALVEAIRRADYVNSLNAFNQLPGCALCAEAPYFGDPYPERPPPNIGIPPPALAGTRPRTAVPVNDSDAQLVGESTGDASWLRTTGLGIVAYMLYSLLANMEFSWGGDEEKEPGGAAEGESDED